MLKYFWEYNLFGKKYIWLIGRCGSVEILKIYFMYVFGCGCFVFLYILRLENGMIFFGVGVLGGGKLLEVGVGNWF